MDVKKDIQKSSQKNPRFIAVDFFCGAGGTTRGLIDAGGYVIAGIDHDERCKETYEKNNPNLYIDYGHARFLNYDIFEASESYPKGQQKEIFNALEDLIISYKDKAKYIPLIFSVCAPCQPFTTLAHDSKMSQERLLERKRDRDLLSQALKFIKKFKPEAVLSENVAGISDPRYGTIWQDFKDELEILKYETDSQIVCASCFGIPQHRKRSILLAIKKNIINCKKIKVEKKDAKINKPISVKKSIGGLTKIKAGESDSKIPNHRSPNLSEKNILRMQCAHPGESNEYMEKNTIHGDLSLACHRRVNKNRKSRCFSDVYTRMHPDRPSPTITTKCHSVSNGRFGHYDKSQVRAISIREAAILQSFPIDYIFYPEDKIVINARMIGNAVPPKLAEFFANYLADSIKPLT